MLNHWEQETYMHYYYYYYYYLMHYFIRYGVT